MKYFNIQKQTCNWFVYFSGLTGNLFLFTFGMMIVWPSPIIPKLQSTDPEINPLGVQVTTIQISVMASLTQLSSPLGLILMAYLADKIGRKKTMLCLAITLTTTLTTVAFARHIYLYYLCLFTYGTCVGCALGLVPIYNSEIANDKNRGRLGGIMGLCIPTGHLVGYLLGSVANVKYFFLSCAIPPAIHIVLSYAIPDSPVWLVIQGKDLEATRALEKLVKNKNAKQLTVEHEKIRRSVTDSNKSKRGVLDLLKNSATRKGLLLGIEVCGVQQLSGIFVILAFMGPIFNDAGTHLSGDIIGTIVGSGEVLVYLLSAYLIDKYGRRILLLLSSFSCVFPLSLLGVYFYLKHIQSEIADRITLLPVLCMIVYIFCYGIGLGPVPIAVLGELFPSDLRAVGVASILIFDNLTLFVVVFCFPLMNQVLGTHWCIWFFGLTSLIGSISIYFTLPETKGRSFAEIQEILSR